MAPVLGPGKIDRRACAPSGNKGGGIGGDTAAILLGLKLYNSFPFLHRYIKLIAGSHHLISQAGWNRCNLSILGAVRLLYLSYFPGWLGQMQLLFLLLPCVHH